MTAHHDLTGWDDFDDHLQYHNDARGDARYLKLDGTSPAMTGPIVTTGPNIDITSASAIERYFRAYGSSGGASFGTDADGNLLIGLLDSAGNILKPIISGDKLGPARMFWDGAERITTQPGGAITTQSHTATVDLIAGQWSRAKYGLSLVNSDLGIIDPDIQGEVVLAQVFDQNAIVIRAKNETAPAVGFQINNGLLVEHNAFLNQEGSFVMEGAITRTPVQQLAAETPLVIAAMVSAGIDPNNVTEQVYIDPAEPAETVWDLGLLLSAIMVRLDPVVTVHARIAANGDILGQSGVLPIVVTHLGPGEYEIETPFTAANLNDLIPQATPQITLIGNKPFTAQADAIATNLVHVQIGDNNAIGTDGAFSVTISAVTTA